MSLQPEPVDPQAEMEAAYAEQGIDPNDRKKGDF